MNIENLIFDSRSIITVASFITFIGILWWSYSPRRRGDFEQAANLPFADEADTSNKENSHG